MITTLVFAVALQGPGLTLIPSGMTAKMGGYVPIRAEMKPVEPSTQWKSGMSGMFAIGAKSYAFVLDEPEGGPAKLWVDANGNGNFADDPATKWDPQKTGELTMYRGTAQVLLEGTLVSLGVYRFDKNDPQRAALKNVLLYYVDFGYQGKLKFGKDEFTVALSGAPAAGSRVWVDRNNNGKSDGRAESVSVGKPFNFGGTTYELKADSGKLNVATSTETVAEIPLPPDLSVGQVAPKFQTVDLAGKALKFPEDYEGKVVLMDFWATWCGPCIEELPNVIKAYEKFHPRGLDVLSISFDQANMADKVTKFAQENKMTWRHVYEGKFWDTTQGRQYGVEAIPFVLLVEGGTGRILATVRDLRGAALDKTLEGVMAQRGK